MHVLAIYGSTYGQAEAVTARIRGPEGTKVSLTVESTGGQPRELTLTRREVEKNFQRI